MKNVFESFSQRQTDRLVTRRRALWTTFLVSGAGIFRPVSSAAAVELPARAVDPAPDLLFGKRLDRLESQVQEIDDLSSEIYQKLLRTGDLYQRLTSVASTLEDLQKLLEDCTNKLGNGDDVAAVKATLGEIKAALAKP
jgi:hypothetical protein